MIGETLPLSQHQSISSELGCEIVPRRQTAAGVVSKMWPGTGLGEQAGALGHLQVILPADLAVYDCSRRASLAPCTAGDSARGLERGDDALAACTRSGSR